MNEKPLQCWVALDNDNVVLTGHCKCMAGQGEVCTHTTALLFLVADLAEKVNAANRSDKPPEVSLVFIL